MTIFNRLCPLLGFLLVFFSVSGQVTEAGSPPSFSPDIEVLVSSKKIQTTSLPAPDMARLRAEDEASPFQSRFAAPISTDLDMTTAGVWIDLPNGARLWRCEIEAPGARGLVLIFDQFDIPAGGRFFAFDADKSLALGAFTQKSCRSDGKMLIGPLPGQKTVLEYFEPASARDQAKFHLYRVDYAYHEGAMAEAASMLGFGDALTCHTNANCQVAANWFKEKKGVARILMVFGNGSGWCSGSLIANTSGSADPYFLTAHHCQLIGNNPDFSMWRFDFFYEAPGCQTPATAPVPMSVLGCERMAYRAETDFMLLKINPIPASIPVYYNGWTRSTTPPQRSYMFHHPRGDIKKYTSDIDPAIVFGQSIAWGGVFGTSPANTHYQTIPETGTYEPGSSGCVLFDDLRRIVGQLHGGNTAPNNPCIVTNTYYGIFNVSWNAGGSPGTRLKEWLDPGNTNAMTQEGYFPPTPPPPPTFSISGNVKTHWNANMPNLVVQVLDGNQTLRRDTTDANGNYLFENLTAGGNYTITPVRDSNDLNGVSTFDLLNISKHLLGLELFDSPWKIISADANQSGTVSTFDIVEIRKALLGISINGFPAPAWRFFPASTTFTDPSAPFPFPAQHVIINNLQANQTGVNFIGVKMGDNNNSASPGN